MSVPRMVLALGLAIPFASSTAQSDTTTRRPRAVEVREWQERRLKIHRMGAYAMVPLFALQTVAGNEIWKAGARHEAQGRWPRLVHATLMMAADAGFTYAGARLSQQAENDLDKRREHRRIALLSVLSASAGVLTMAIFGR